MADLNRYKVVVTKEYWVDAVDKSGAHEIFYDKGTNLLHREVGARAHKVSQSTVFTLKGKVVNL